MNWKIEELNVSEIFLDQENIRTPISAKDQNALIQDMFVNEAAIELVKSYSENGAFPDEFPIVVKSRKKYIVIEGNRRMAALKGMITPSIIPQFEKEIKKYNMKKLLKARVVIAPSRKAAIKHIANKHVINLRKSWKPLRQAYFYKSLLDNGMTIEQIIESYPQHDVVRHVKMLEMHKIAKSIKFPDDQASIIHDERSYPITTLERFYNDQNVKDFLGYEFKDNGEVKINIAKKEFTKGYKKIIEDIADGTIDSRKYNKANERKDYLDGLGSPVTPNKSKKGTTTSKSFKEQPKPKSKSKKTSKRKLKYLFKKSDIPYGLKSSALKIMYDEICTIDVEKHPNALHDFLRSFLECSLLTFLKETNDFVKLQKNANHNPKIGEMLGFITKGKSSKITDENLINALKLEIGRFDSNYSIARMHGINHNELLTSTEKDVRSTFALLENLFKIILNPDNGE